MQCPLCLDTPLTPTFVQGVEVDVCPTCRGMWLDRGELDRFLSDPVAPAPPRVGSEAGGRPSVDAPRGSRRDEQSKRPKKQKSKGKRLADLLDDILDL